MVATGQRVMHPLRISFPLEGLLRSGGTRMLLALANHLATRGHAVDLWVPSYAADAPWPLHPHVERRVIDVPGGRFRQLRYLRALARVALRDADVAYATGYKTPWLLRASARAPQCRLLYFVQGHDAETATQHQRGLMRAILRTVGARGYRAIPEVVAVSRFVADAVGRPDATIIPNGIDPMVFTPIGREPAQDHRVRVGVIANDAPVKGFDLFMSAFRRLGAGTRERLQLLVVRHGGSVPADLGADEVLDPRDDIAIADFFRRCDVFVFPSRREGFGLPALEAMGCGAAVITADCGGVREFTTSDNAVVVPLDDAEALAAAITRVVADQPLRAGLQANAVATANGFTLARCLDRHAALVERT